MPLLRTLSLLITTLLGGCSALAPVNWLVPSSGYDALEGLSYGELPRQRLDVYLPAELKPDAPVVVFYYGGSWRNGERADYRFVGQALASRGMIAVIPDYRLYPEVRYPEFLRDSAKALAWTQAHRSEWRSQNGPLFVMGHSAGAYNAAMLALDERWLAQQGHHITELAGWVGLAGPYDFIPLKDKSVQPVFHHPDVPPDSQPIAHASARAPRTFLGVANFDAQVNPDTNSGHLASKLESLGVPVIFKRYEGVDHLTLIGAFSRPLHRMAPVLDDVAAFVNSLPEAPRKNGP